MLSDVTMILGTKDRQITVQQILDYYAGSHLHIIVADATTQALEDSALQRPGLRVTYMHNPDMNFIPRINLALEHVTTPFVMMRADRRHISISGIRAACDFLNSHPEYNSAQGKWYIREHTGIGEVYTAYANTPVAELDNPEERVKKTMAIYQPIFYAVFRANTFKYILSYFKTLTRGVIIELCINLMSMHVGKHKSLNTPYAFIAAYEACAPYNKRMFVNNTAENTFDSEKIQQLSYSMARHMDPENTSLYQVFYDAFSVYYNAMTPFAKNVHLPLAQATNYYRPYFDYDFSCYASLIVKKIYTHFQVQPVRDLFEGLDDTVHADMRALLSLAGERF